MRLADNEPPCLAEGLSHAWVPLRHNPDNATCGRCHTTRLKLLTRIAYLEPRAIERAQD